MTNQDRIADRQTDRRTAFIILRTMNTLQLCSSAVYTVYKTKIKLNYIQSIINSFYIIGTVRSSKIRHSN